MFAAFTRVVLSGGRALSSPWFAFVDVILFGLVFVTEVGVVVCVWGLLKLEVVV